jgi:hypothetical protein
MNNQEAKLILQAYRLGGQDAADPQFHEALEQFKRDPDLARWFSEERAIETRVQAKLKAAIQPPAHLKASLLAQRKIVRPVVWWRQPAWLAAAAAIVLLAAIAMFWIQPSHEPRFAAFRQAMVQNSMNMTDHVSFMAQDMSQIQQWLKERDIDTNFDLPAALRDKPIQGCRVIDWKGQKVTLICFMHNGKDGKEHVDLFVIDRTHFRDLTPSATPQFARADGLTTASWVRGQKTYLLTSTADETVLRKYL